MRRLINISIYIVIFLILAEGVVFAAGGTIVASGDIITTNWTSGTCISSLWGCISEGTISPNDLNYIQTPVGTTATYVYTNTTSPSDVATVTDLTITVRAQKTGGRSGTLSVYYSTDGSDPTIQIGLTVNLIQGVLTNHTFTANGLSLTKTQIDNLRIKYVATLGSNGTGGQTAAQVTASQTDITYNQATSYPSSSNFGLLDFGFGAGGTATSSSTNYLFQGILGEVETGSPSSSNYISLPGLTYTLEPNVPAAPSLTNPSNYYNKLNIIIDNGGNTTDTTFTIQISADPYFANNVYYVQADNTLGTIPVFQTYTAWGGASGFNIIGLTGGTTYYARVAAKRGTFQQGQYSGKSSASTVNPTLTFNVQTSTQASPPFNVGIGVVNPGQVTTSWQKVITSITTNVTNGGLVYVYGTNNGLKSTTAGNYIISSSNNDLTSASEGYGARGLSVTQTSGGPMELISPYNGTGNTVGVVDTSKRVLADSSSTPVTNGQTTFELKAKASNTTPSANDYADTITLIGTGSF